MKQDQQNFANKNALKKSIKSSLKKELEGN